MLQAEVTLQNHLHPLGTFPLLVGVAPFAGGGVASFSGGGVASAFNFTNSSSSSAALVNVWYMFLQEDSTQSLDEGRRNCSLGSDKQQLILAAGRTALIAGGRCLAVVASCCPLGE